MAVGALDLDVLIVTALVGVERPLGLADQVHPVGVLEDDRPVGIVRAERRVDREPRRELHEELDVLVVVEALREASLDIRVDLDVIEGRLAVVLHPVEQASSPIPTH